MLFNILLLIWGMVELLIGIIVALKKELLVLKSIIEGFTFVNREFEIGKIKDIKSFSKWIGEIVLVEGAVYIFLASAAIYFNMKVFIVLIFIFIIEIIFFNIISKEIQLISKE